MSGHFPFGAPNGPPGQQPQFTSAQLRAALAAASGIDESLFLQQQRQQHDFQRDLRLRQMLLMEQMDQQSALESLLQEQQLRALGQHMHDFPDLQQQYQSLLLNEHRQALARAQVQAQLQALQAPDAAASSGGVAQFASQAQATAQAQLQLEQEQLLQQQNQQAQPVAEPAVVGEDMPLLRDLAVDSMAGNAAKRPAGPQDDRKRPASSEDDDAVQTDDDTPQPLAKRSAKEPNEPSKKTKPQTAHKVKKKKTPSQVMSNQFIERKPRASKAAAKAMKKSKTSVKSAGGAKSTSKSVHKANPTKTPSKATKAVSKSITKHKRTKLTTIQSGTPQSFSSPQVASTSASFVPETVEHSVMSPMSEETGYAIGSLEGLIAAADAENRIDQAVITLCALKESKEDTDWSDSDKEDAIDAPPLTTPVKKSQVITLPSGFTSVLPELPEEPLWEGDSDNEHELSATGLDTEEREITESGAADEITTNIETPEMERKGGRVISNVLEYPYAIDVWWPAITAIRNERRMAGDESDEDAFEEEPQPENEQPPYRANAQKIRTRLARDTNPGVFEKLPHCKIHRLLMKRKKNLSAPELVYCWQVTEIYPNDLMVCCSICGTWRHAACGGHYKPYSRRENTTCDFVPVCDLCHEESKILCDFPRAEQRIERQRMEQLRRGLATSAVMRHAAFSKHGGTYSWPLGRVAPAKFGGHSRSVHARHDKAEKQWTDMANKLSRVNASRPKERSRVRTKELERLLVSVEDAEAHTDRHNMILFLMRDTAAEHPVGFEKIRRNVFDPEEDETATARWIEMAKPKSGDEDVLEGGNPFENALFGPAVAVKDPSAEDDTDHKESIEHTATKSLLQCSREGCSRRPRFDSAFCSDACGVSTLEKDLLRSLYDCSEIHPAVLRN